MILGTAGPGGDAMWVVATGTAPEQRGGLQPLQRGAAAAVQGR